MDHHGPQLVNSIGYSYEDLLSEVDGKITSRKPLATWNLLMTPCTDRTMVQRFKLSSIFLWQNKGVLAVLRLCLGRLFRFFCTSFRVVLAFIGQLSFMKPVKYLVQKSRVEHSARRRPRDA